MLMQQLLILSDIHGNVSALESVLTDVKLNYMPAAAVILGDSIDYGMRSNEVIDILRKCKIPIISNLWGNHEYAIIHQDYRRFSSRRGVVSAQYTREHLTAQSLEYLHQISGKEGKEVFQYCGKTFLAVHGNLTDPFWGSISVEADFGGYEEYDYVLSGHSHLAHSFPVFYQTNNPKLRNKKRTVFINPGSVGQPRNHDPRAQYAVLDFDKGIILRCVNYDIGLEQSLFTDEIDMFYKERLSDGV